ncbi:MAG: tRNA (adenosine(37)-N6)-threonylcarbamoyltransferase complex dimerization subunit type 1 TsaB [Steroidobacteraceae bacterium]
MKILALDTATGCCSTALHIGATLLVREEQTDRGHAQLILPMIDALLAEAGIRLGALDAIAFGRGPGAFTGLRLAASVTQGLAFAASLPVLPVSDLRAVALRGARLARQQSVRFTQVLVCQDARMREIYTARFAPDTNELMRESEPERVIPPDQLNVPGDGFIGAGSGFAEYAEALAGVSAALALCLPQCGPHAREIAELGAADLRRGGGLPADAAQPVYLRDDVARPTRPTPTP